MRLRRPIISLTRKNRGARKAQEKARRAGVPVYYSINGQIIEVKL